MVTRSFLLAGHTNRGCGLPTGLAAGAGMDPAGHGRTDRPRRDGGQRSRGIDTVTHQTALDLYGKTVAVLGAGLDQYAVPGNRSLQDEIRERGLLVSQFPKGFSSHRSNFPASAGRPAVPARRARRWRRAAPALIGVRFGPVAFVAAVPTRIDQLVGDLSSLGVGRGSRVVLSRTARTRFRRRRGVHDTWEVGTGMRTLGQERTTDNGERAAYGVVPRVGPSLWTCPSGKPVHPFLTPPRP